MSSDKRGKPFETDYVALLLGEFARIDFFGLRQGSSSLSLLYDHENTRQEFLSVIIWITRPIPRTETPCRQRA